MRHCVNHVQKEIEAYGDLTKALLLYAKEAYWPVDVLHEAHMEN